MDESELRSPLARRFGRRALLWLDAGAAVVYTLLMLTLSAAPETSALAAVPVAAAAGLPLAVRRLWPVPVFAAVLAASTAALLLGLPFDSYAAAAYALYPVALARRRRRWIPTPLIGAASAVLIFGGAIVGPADWHAEIAGEAVLGLAVLGASWTLGRVVRERRAEAGRAARRLVDQAVSDERLRIARELHDVVAHSMSLIAVKAGVAVHVAEARPEEALDALRVIETTSRSSLAEMRHLLGVLRTDTDLGPAPGLADLTALAERAAMAGVHVDLEVDAPALPEGVALSAYRIVQEAVTNVVKHAAPARCDVRIRADGRRVRIDVTDDGPGTRVLPGGDGGHGLIGMRERVMMYGGDFTAGPRRGGGFAVSADFPYEP
ncbi:Signal transduction histidine kinase [Actinomadura meyerae]|uniref:histidine kinase n=1 Tax=Actinomadura meyerae TaxID=240840 RepID=A0A239MTW0_9ACTN|nr:sensor histidine kinase [Actinomadura meyerae]SNT45408.1 Signal transduction histidine kinase [Actinomadura meyerae]